MKNVRFNETLCKVVIEEENSITSVCVCGPHQKWRAVQGGNSNAGSEEMFKEEFYDSEGSDYGHLYDVGVADGEEVSVKFLTVGVSSQGGEACNGITSGGRVSSCGGGYTNMEGYNACMSKKGLAKCILRMC